MADPVPFDEHAERLKIRSAPAPVSRINRKVVILGAGFGFLALFAAASIALSPPRAVDPADRRELYNTTNKRAPDGLAALPASYADLLPVEERVARLGPPLTGDLGSTILAAEQELGLTPITAQRYEDDFRPNPEDEAIRAERIKAAKLEAEAAKAPVFFQLAATARSARGEDQTASSASLSSELLALSRPPALSTSSSSLDPNMQDRKLAFASGAQSTDTVNPSRIADPLSPDQLMAGSVISAALVTGLNSDLPGGIVAQVTQPVFDTVTGRTLLIPAGARLIGRYQSEVSFGQSRALVTWDRIIFPDGASISISEPGTDAAGYAGLRDRTDHHWDRIFAAAGLATILGIGAELGTDDGDLERAVRRGVGDTVNEAGQRVVDRNLGIQPTITVRPGWPVRVTVTRDLVLRPYSQGEIR